MDFSQITDDLFVGRTPTLHDQKMLIEKGVELIINMRFEARPHPSSPVKTHWLPTFDSPLIWIPLRKLQRGVEAAQTAIQGGGKVFVHCQAGVHRASAMACCILISQGYTPEAAMELLKSRRPAADPYIWYIRRQILSFGKKLARQSREKYND
jgi:atypical dual specificity phosphatase